MPLGTARLKAIPCSAARIRNSCALAVLIFFFGSKALQNAVAEGETRSISMHHIHTGEDITITYKREGHYDEAALEKLNWFLRDWRRNQQTRMDPHLIDLIWEVQRETGAKQPIWVICGYRSPATNAMLRRRSSGVARASQHMLGHAMDFYIPGVPLEELRVLGLRLQRGGVGFYPTSGSPFVHMDTAGIRMWPRMTRDQLLRVFPDGRTVYLPTDGRPLPGYALALADVRKRGSAPAGTAVAAGDPDSGVNSGATSNTHSLRTTLASFFGLPENDAEENEEATTATASNASAAAPAAKPVTTPARVQPARYVVAAADPNVQPKTSTSPQSRPATAPPKAVTTPQPVAATATPPAASNATQTILARASWDAFTEAVANATPVARPENPLSGGVPVARPQFASALGVAGLPGARPAPEDRVAPELALAYAEQPEHALPAPASSPAARPMGRLSVRAIAPARLPTPPAATTIAVKREAHQAGSMILAAGPTGASMNDDNPWLRAIVMSPNVRRYLTAVAFGGQDLRALTPLMRKPASLVMMTFSAEPNHGLAEDHFSGSAVVFVSTVTYQTHTASLR